MIHSVKGHLVKKEKKIHRISFANKDFKHLVMLQGHVIDMYNTYRTFI